MGDEFDGCECIWTHEMAMQRLLNFVSYCDDLFFFWKLIKIKNFLLLTLHRYAKISESVPIRIA